MLSDQARTAGLNEAFASRGLTPALCGSALVHAASVAAFAVAPQLWPDALGAIALNHAALFTASLMFRSSLLGPKVTQLSPAAIARREIALTFDDGPTPELTPRLLDFLDEHRARATFFCIGERAARYPQLVREIARRGHAVENHSYAHGNAFPLRGPAGFYREVLKAQLLLSDLTQRTPTFFRAPFGVRSPLLQPALAKLSLTYVSWTRRGRDATDRNGERVFRRVSRDLAAGDILLLHDGVSYRQHPGDACLLAVLPRLFALIAERGLKCVTLPAAFE